MSHFLRQLWKQKPDAWGPVESVQRSLRVNSEKNGINYQDISLALPFFSPKSFIDYSKNNLSFTDVNDNTVFENKGLNCGDHRDLRIIKNNNNNGILTKKTKFTLFSVVTITSIGTMSPDFFPTLMSDREIYNPANIFLEWRLGRNYQTLEYSHHLAYRNASKWKIYDIRTFDSKVGNKIPFTIGATADYSNNLVNFYQDGIKKTGIITLNQTSNPPEIAQIVSIGGPLYATSTYPDTVAGSIYTMLKIDDILSDNQMATLSDFPYQFWHRVTDVYYSLPVGGGGGISFVLSMLNSTMIPSIQIEILRNILTNISNASSVSDIEITINQLISFIMMISNNSTASDISTNIERFFRVNLSNPTDTSIIVQNILRNININPTNQTTASNLVHSILRLFSAFISNSSSVSDISASLNNLIAFVIGISNQTSTPDIEVSILRILQLAILNNTTSPDISAQILRNLQANMGNLSDVSNISALLGQLIQYSLNISNSSAASEVPISIIRALVLEISNDIQTAEDIEHVTSREFLFKATNPSFLCETDIQVLRRLSLNISNGTLTSDSLAILLSVISALINVSGQITQNVYSGIIQESVYSSSIGNNIYSGTVEGN